MDHPMQEYWLTFGRGNRNITSFALALRGIKQADVDIQKLDTEGRATAIIMYDGDPENALLFLVKRCSEHAATANLREIKKVS